MTTIKNLPKVLVSRNNGGYEAVTGLKMNSILKKDLFLSRGDHKHDKSESNERNAQVKLQKGRECFLHAVSSWSSDTCLELHMTAVPDLSQGNNDQVTVSIFLRSWSREKEIAMENVMSRFLSIVPLVDAFMSEAEFVPILDDNDLNERLAPYMARNALSLCRRDEYISLSSPLKRLTIGFGDMDFKESIGSDLIRHIYPWHPTMDDWSGLLDCLTGQLDLVKIIVRVIPGLDSTVAEKRLGDTILTCETFLAGQDSGVDSRQQIKLIRDVALKHLAGIRESRLNMSVFIIVPENVERTIANVIGKTIAGPVYNSDDVNLFQGGFNTVKVQMRDALRWDFLPEKEPFAVTEASCAFRLPDPPEDYHSELPVRRSRTSHVVLPSENRNNRDNIELFINEYRGRSQTVSISADDRMTHAFIIGKTGTGKSTLMESMILQDIDTGRGVAVIDPHGDMVDSILGKMSMRRAEDVVLFDMLDREKPLGLNLLEWKTEEERDIIIDELYLSIDKIYDLKHTGGPIFENNFRGVLALLMGDKPEKDFVPTLLEFSYFYLNPKFRKWLKANTKITKLHDFLDELERTGGDISINNLAPYITSKFSRYIYDATLRRIVAQERSSIDFDDILNNGKIFLMKLGRGRFGANVSALIANQIVTRFKLAAMKRGEMRPEDRRDFFMYIDECHTLPGENFIELLSEARKFRLGLILATQFASQLGNPISQKNDLLSAILGNVGSIFIFRLGIQDADFFAPALYPSFTPDDISGLPNWNGYAKINVSNHYTSPFSFRSVKNNIPYDHDTAVSIIELSKAKYGMDAAQVDEQIEKRREKWKKESPTDANDH
jgi:hypothetical protein